MKKLILGISVFALVLFALASYSTSARADNRGNDRPENRNENRNNKGIFDGDNQLSKSKCVNPSRNPVINVTQKVQNDVDSGDNGYWAFDYYTRHITVWSTGASTYCAIVTYDGNFYAVPGQNGPGMPVGIINTPTNAPVNGAMSGGYRATFTGTFAPTDWSTSGNVGTTNYQCNLAAVCPGQIDWVAKYFPGYNSANFAQPWWGWQYKGGSHGTWINASDLDSGNIL